MAKPKNEGPEELQILNLDTGRVDFCILGSSPFVFNSMSLKAKSELLYPRGRLSTADKASRMKHDPMSEYRASVYAHQADDQPTRLKFPAAAFKRATATAALDIPGAKKAQIGRLVWAVGQDVNIWGVPQLYMAVVRSSDMNRTPDIRTRAIVPQWATRVTIQYVRPVMNHKSIANLLAAAGLIVGVGDGRQEKGALNNGQFEIVAEDDPRYVAIVKSGGRVAQDRAMKDPAFYDRETQELFSWFTSEVSRRGADKEPPPKGALAPKAKRNGAEARVNGH